MTFRIQLKRILTHMEIPIVIIAIILSLFIILRILRKAGKTKEKKAVKVEGKRCPDCRTIINAKREVCQHCGHVFEKKESS